MGSVVSAAHKYYLPESKSLTQTTHQMFSTTGQLVACLYILAWPAYVRFALFTSAGMCWCVCLCLYAWTLLYVCDVRACALKPSRTDAQHRPPCRRVISAAPPLPQRRTLTKKTPAFRTAMMFIPMSTSRYVAWSLDGFSLGVCSYSGAKRPDVILLRCEGTAEMWSITRISRAAYVMHR